MKKIIYSILCLSLILSNISISNVKAIENNEEVEDVVEQPSTTPEVIDISLLTYEIVDGEVTITDCDENASGNLIIPSEIEGYPVTKIGDEAFSNCRVITQIEIPNSVKTIGVRAFYYCQGIENVIFPSSLKTIEDYAFSCTMRLKNVVIPNSVTKMGARAFSQSDIVNITLSESMKVIEEELFYYCDSLETVTIPEGIEKIEQSAFEYCKKLKEVVLPDSVTSINDYAFQHSGLEVIQLSSNLKTIGENAFYNTKLMKLEMPDSVTSVGKSAFSSTKLTSATLSKNLKVLEDYLFEYCSSLENIEIPYGVEEIKSHVFTNCNSLKEITIPNSVHTIGYNAIYDCDSLEKVYMSNNLTTADFSAISGNPNLVFLELPKTLVNFESNSFFGNSLLIIGCYKDSYVAKYFEKNDHEYYLIDGTTKENTISGKYQNMSWKINKKTGKMTIDCEGEMPLNSEGVVPWQYRQLNKYITNVTISDGCVSIAYKAFEYCYRLTSVTLPDTLEVIEEKAFKNANLKSIELPDNILIIDNNAFSGNYNVENIKLPSNLLYIGNEAFSSCSLEEIELPEYLLYIGDYAFSGNKLTSIEIPDFVEVVGYSAFSSNDLKEIVFPHSVTYIGDDVVSDNENLEKIVIYRKDCELPGRLTIEDVTVYGFKGSTAEALAKEEGYDFVALTNVDVGSLNLVAELGYDQTTYNGKKKTPKVTIYGLTKDVDYKVKYMDNVNAGTALIKITGIGDYTGEGYITFEILPADASEFSAKLNYTKLTYNGKAKTPTVTVTDANGNILEKDKDYTVTYGSNIKNVGRHSVTINYIGNYKGSKKLWFTVVPAAPKTVNAELYGYDDIEVKWSESTGASGYYVYYRRIKDNDYTYAGKTTELSYKIPDLKDGYRYTVKIVPYYASSNGNIYKSIKYAEDCANTLIKIKNPVISKYSDTKVKVTWKNIYYETGYQISRKTSSSGYYIASTYETTSGTSRLVKSTKGVTYYYKVRAYYTKEDGTKIYGPWSNAVKYRY